MSAIFLYLRKLVIFKFQPVAYINAKGQQGDGDFGDDAGVVILDISVVAADINNGTKHSASLDPVSVIGIREGIRRIQQKGVENMATLLAPLRQTFKQRVHGTDRQRSGKEPKKTGIPKAELQCESGDGDEGDQQNEEKLAEAEHTLQPDETDLAAILIGSYIADGAVLLVGDPPVLFVAAVVGHIEEMVQKAAGEAVTGEVHETAHLLLHMEQVSLGRQGGGNSHVNTSMIVCKTRFRV